MLTERYFKNIENPTGGGGLLSELINYCSNIYKGIFIICMNVSNRYETSQMNMETNTKNVTWTIYFLIVVSEK